MNQIGIDLIQTTISNLKRGCTKLFKEGLTEYTSSLYNNEPMSHIILNPKLKDMIENLRIITEIFKATNTGSVATSHKGSQGEFDSPRRYQKYSFDPGLDSHSTGFYYPKFWDGIVNKWPSSIGLQAHRYDDFVEVEHRGNHEAFHFIVTNKGEYYFIYAETKEELEAYLNETEGAMIGYVE